MFHGFFHIYSLSRIQFNHLGHKVQTNLTYKHEFTLSKFLKNCSGGVGLNLGNVGLKSGRSAIPGHSFTVGVP